MSRPVLVVGIPRSGTTWVAHVLAQTGGATYLEEPDNHFRRPYAFRVKRRVGKGEYPSVSPGETVPEYEALWRHALTIRPRGYGSAQQVRRRVAARLLASVSAVEVSATIAGRSPVSVRLRAVERLALPERPPDGECLVAKSVYAPLALEWIDSHFEPKVVVVIRDPLNVVSSWLTMGWLKRAEADMLDELDPTAQTALARSFGVPRPDRNASPLVRAAWLSGALTASLVAAAARRPDWHLVSHERVCEHPRDRLSRLATDLGLRWTDEVDRHLEGLNQQGTGYDITRVAAELPEIWRSRLTPEEAQEASSVLKKFPAES